MLDRMALDDVGANPVRIAEAIHAQLGDNSGAVDVADIARALDIIEIRVEPMWNMEGALVTDRYRDRGVIAVNALSSPRRRRFTLGHELGHFLAEHHVPNTGNGFSCGKMDMLERPAKGMTPHQRQGSEANAFSIELLAPVSRLKRYRHGLPDLEAVLEISEQFDISREAAARRYVEIHAETLAVVFVKDGRAVYSMPSRGVPYLSVQRGMPIPDLSDPEAASGVTEMNEVDGRDWLARRGEYALSAQTLHQAVGRKIVLLHAPDVDDDGGSEAFSDLPGFGRR